MPAGGLPYVNPVPQIGVTPPPKGPQTFSSDPPQGIFVDPIFGLDPFREAGVTQEIAPRSPGKPAGIPGGIRFPTITPLPSFTAVNSGSTAELERLKELEARVQAFMNRQVPQQAQLHPLAAIAAGALSALDPRGEGQRQQQIEAFRQAPVEQFNREQAQAAQGIEMSGQLGAMQTSAENRQMALAQVQQGVDSVFRNAQTIISGASEAARQLGESDDEGDQMAAKEIMRRALLLREMVEGAMEAEPGSVGQKFVDTAMGEIQGITDILDERRGVVTKTEELAEQREFASGLQREAQRLQHGYRMEEIRLGKEMSMQQAVAVARIRAQAVMQNSQNQFVKKHAEDYLNVSGLMPVLDRLDELAAMGAGGPLEGMMPLNALANEVGRLSASLMDMITFGSAGKAFTEQERALLIDSIPTRYSTTTHLSSQVRGARLRVMLKLQTLEGLAQLYSFDTSRIPQGDIFDPTGTHIPGVQLPPGVTPVGQIDSAVFGINDVEGR